MTYAISQLDAFKWLENQDDESIDCFITDYPYESLEKHRKKGTTTRLSQSCASSNKWFGTVPNSKTEELLYQAFRVLKNNSHAYFFCDDETSTVLVESFGKVQERLKDEGSKVKLKYWKRLVWDKCLHPDTLIHTTEGIRKVGTIKEGDQVLGPDGSWVKARAVRTTKKSTTTLVMSDGTSVTCSPCHRFPVEGDNIEAKDIVLGNRIDSVTPWGQRNELLSSEFIRKEDLVVELKYLASENVRVMHQNDYAFMYPTKIDLDYDLGRFVGLFAAEGTFLANGITFAFHENEKHLHNHVSSYARRLGLRTTYTNHDTKCLSVNVYSKFVTSMMRAFVGGNKAPNKYLTPLAKSGNKEFTRGIMKGLVEGDGHWGQKAQRWTFCSSSPSLSYFVLDCVRSLGFSPKISRRENEHAGFWVVGWDPKNTNEDTRPTVIANTPSLEPTDLIDISVDHKSELFALGNGMLTHNCHFGMGYHYRCQYEFILFFEKGKRKLNNLSIPDVLSFKRIKKKTAYPTEKPAELLEVLIANSCQPGELVADPFMGSGSTGVAALRQGCMFIGNDISQDSIVLASLRLQETYKNPTLEHTEPIRPLKPCTLYSAYGQTSSYPSCS